MGSLERVSARLVFPEPDSARDLLTFASRVTKLGDEAVRLVAASGVLVVTAAPLAPRGLLDVTPTVLGMRVLAVDPELSCDLVVRAETLAPALGDERAVTLPESAVSAAWAGISPPRTGWAEAGAIAAATLAKRAQFGIASVAETVPTDAGEDAVRAVRARVWGAADDALDSLPLGTAFAAFALGFIGGEEQARVRTAGAWTRVTLHRGHVLVRGPVRSGLTAVRATGTP